MTDTTTTESDARALDLLDRYVRFWNAGSEEEQRRLADEVFAEGVEYSSHVGVFGGKQALAGFRRQFADHVGAFTLRLREQPQRHHHCARLKWELLTGKEETSFATGTDVLSIADNGRIVSIIAFLDQPPEGFTPDPHR
ncbi:hypothetical protein [Phaeacidiphilus oryzae]|uniref:hypothetical protein n=1 Tax=Phaeacidiphilus oryzae TaxID=348818 RepID=UPI0005601FB5|nr:hypothetical protein [Phaeacidiphilus oryzae]